MKRVKYIITGSLLFCMSSFLYAKTTMRIADYKYAGPVTISPAFIVDKEDVNNNTWSNKNLIQTYIDLDRINDSQNFLTTDTAGWITLPQDSLADRLHLFRFTLTPSKYLKAQLEITATGCFEVFINDKKEKSSTHKAKNTDDADPVYINLSMIPQQYEVTIKYLTEKKANDTIRLKSALKITKGTVDDIKTEADGKRPLTINDIIEGKRLSSASISPSGKYYIASYREFHNTEKSYSSHELIEIKSGKTLYTSPATVNPRWMPSSDKLLFWRKGISDHDLVIFDPLSMREEIILKGIELQSTHIAPNEEFLIFTKKDKAPETTGSLKRLLAPDDRIAGYRDRNSLYLYRIADKTLVRLTFGKTDTYLGDISGDSKKLLFFTGKRDLSKLPFKNNGCFVLHFDSMSIDTIFVDNRYIDNGQFSPDGKQILFTGHPDAFDGIATNILPGQLSNGYNTQAFVMNLENKEVTAVTRDFYPSISAANWWDGDDKIYFRTIDKDREQMYRYCPKNKKYERLPLREDIIQRFSLPRKGNTALYVGQSIKNSNRLYSYDLKSGKSLLLADPFASQLDKIELGEVHDYQFYSGQDTIEGRYYLPPHFDADKKYPMIVYYYGGTTPTARLFESRYPLNVYAAMGYVVLTLQPSGTIGFGQEFAARHVNAWGKQTADEIIEGTKQFCASHPFVNKEKIGCIGASYGGFMTQFLQTQTDIFAAAVSHAGISNLASYWGEGYWGYSYSSLASTGSYPWNNPELYVNQSPLFHADKINTPLLLLHGAVDTNVPVGESIQMFNALKILGKEVEFIEISGENHAITAYKKRLEWNKRILAWFAKWLKDEPEWWSE